MAYKPPSEYKTKNYSYPSDRINPELKKNKEWFLAFCEALWADHCSGRTYNFNMGGGRSADELYAYAVGSQSVNKVKGYLYKKANPMDPNSGFVTKSNISYDGYDVMPKMFDVIRSFNQKIDYEVNATAVDDTSLDDKTTDRETIKHFIEPNVKQVFDKLGTRPPMSVNPEEVGVQSEQDVDLLIDTGGYQTQAEIAAQVVTNKTKKESYFPVVQAHCFDDLAIIAAAGKRTFIDKNTNIPKVRKVNMKMAIVPQSEWLDFRDITRAAEIRSMTIAEIREETDLSLPQLMDLAKAYSFMNPDYQKLMTGGGGYYSSSYRTEYMSTYGIDPLNDVRVLVLDMQCLSLDIQTYRDYVQRDGAANFSSVEWDYAMSKEDGKRKASVERKQFIRKYEAMWVIGTQHFLNYGIASNVKYKGEKGSRKPMLDFHFARTGNKSLVERCISHIDDINTALFKRRAAIATLPPAPRMIIEQGLLENVDFNGTVQEPEDLLRTFEEKGILVVNRVDEFGKYIQTGSGKVIDFVPSGIIEDITMFSNEIVQGIERIKEVTGVNDIVAASTPENRVGLGVSQLSNQASQNALFPTFNTYKFLFEPTFEDIIGKWQVVVRDNERSVEHTPLGTTTTQVYKVGNEFAKAKFSLKVDMVIGESEKQMLLQEITNLKDARRQNGGSGGITSAQYLKIYDIIMSGNRKLAMYVLAQIEKAQNERDTAMTRENQTATFQAQKESGIAVEQEKQRSLRMGAKLQNKSKLIEAAAERKKELQKQLVTPGKEGQPNPNRAEIMAFISECDQEIAALMQPEPEEIAEQQAQQQAAQQQQGGQQIAA